MTSADEDSKEVLRKALKDLHSNETFERALGRILRSHGRGFEDYMELMSLVRERAKRDGLEILEAAKREASGA